MRPIAYAPVLLALVAACAPADPGVRAATRIDSAGVTITTSRAPAWRAAEAWRIDPVPALQIGRVDGEPAYLFAGIADIRRGANGEVLVAQRTEIRAFDARGRFLRSFGAEGDGPGEFRRLERVEACGGRLIASEVFLPRLTVFDPAGELLEVRPLPVRTRSYRASFVGCLTGAPVLSVSPVRARDVDRTALRRDTLALTRMGADGTPGDTLLRFPGTEIYDGLLRPFARSSVYAFADSAIYLGTNDDYEIRVYTARGALRGIIRRTVTPVEVTSADIERIRADYLRGVPQRLAEREIVPRLDAVPYPETMPFYEEFQLDGAGNLWVREYYPFKEGERPRWSVFSPAGAWLGDVDAPVGLTVYDIGPDYVLGVWRDALGVEYVRLHRIIKPAR